MVTYGIISDADRSTPWEDLKTTLNYFKEREVDGILWVGEIGQLVDTLKWIDDEKVHTYMIPGSHESVGLWDAIFKHIEDNHDKQYFHNGVKRPKFTKTDHGHDLDLVMVPGSELTAGQGSFYMFENLRTGELNDGTAYNFNVNDLDRLITRPGKTLIASHVPPRLSGKYATDWAHFAEKEYKLDDSKETKKEKIESSKSGLITDLSSIPKPGEITMSKGGIAIASDIPEDVLSLGAGKADKWDHIESIGKGSTTFKPEKSPKSLVPGYIGELYNELLDEDEQFDVQRENRGHEGLAKIIAKKFPGKNEIVVHGNFEESCHKACDRDGDPLDEEAVKNEPVSNLYFNASCLDLARAGIIHIHESSLVGTSHKASFEKLTLRQMRKALRG